MQNDTPLQKLVGAELAWDPSVTAGHIGVIARSRKATARVAWAAPGVTGVENDIAVV